jgi:hypothetical protein
MASTGWSGFDTSNVRVIDRGCDILLAEPRPVIALDQLHGMARLNDPLIAVRSGMCRPG